MPPAWRLCKARHITTAWDGRGAAATGGRWNSPGTPVVYTASSRALAMLEILVHLAGADVLSAYVAIQIDFEESQVTVLGASELPPNWQAYPHPPETRAIGDDWVARLRTPVLRVPTAVVPFALEQLPLEVNYLLNPNHPEFARLRSGPPLPFGLDPRLR